MSRLALALEVVKEGLGTNFVSFVVSVNSIVRVRRANHVVVEVESDLVSFLFRKLLSVV